MLSSTPTAAIITLTDVPPALKNGSGSPVVGSIPVTTPMLMNACKPIIEVMPAPSRQPKRSRQASDTRSPASTNSTNSAITVRQPISPKSSPTIAKMKSDSG